MSGREVSFFVPGIPAPGGSKRGFYRPGKNGAPGRVSMVDAGKRNKEWRACVAVVAHQAMVGQAPLTGPLELVVGLVMPRPKGHYGTGKKAGTLKASAPYRHTSKPDTTKLLRAIEDAMTGIVWADDAQVSDQEARKRYGDKPGATITVRELSTSPE